MRWQDVRFGPETRLELKSREVARPLVDRFRRRGSGDEGPAGILVECAFGRTVPNTDPDVDLRGAEVCREVYIGEIDRIVAPLISRGGRS